MLVVVVITAIIIGSIMASMATGFSALDKARTFNQPDLEVALALELLEKDLMNAVPVHSPEFQGGGNTIFFTSLVDGLGKRNDSGPIVARVKYTFDKKSGALDRAAWPFTEPAPAEGGTERLVSALETVHYAYWFQAEEDGAKDDEPEWQEKAQEGGELPTGVKATITFKKGSRTVRIDRVVLLKGM